MGVGVHEHWNGISRGNEVLVGIGNWIEKHISMGIGMTSKLCL